MAASSRPKEAGRTGGKGAAWNDLTLSAAGAADRAARVEETGSASTLDSSREPAVVSGSGSGRASGE